MGLCHNLRISNIFIIRVLIVYSITCITITVLCVLLLLYESVNHSSGCVILILWTKNLTLHDKNVNVDTKKLALRQLELCPLITFYMRIREQIWNP